MGGSVDKGQVFWVRECLGKGRVVRVGGCPGSKRLSSGGKCLRGVGRAGGRGLEACHGVFLGKEWGGACPLDGDVSAL